MQDITIAIGFDRDSGTPMHVLNYTPDTKISDILKDVDRALRRLTAPEPVTDAIEGAA